MAHIIVNNYVGSSERRSIVGPRLTRKNIQGIDTLIRDFLKKIADPGGVWRLDVAYLHRPSDCDFDVVVEVSYSDTPFKRESVHDGELDKKLLVSVQEILPHHSVTLWLNRIPAGALTILS